MALSLDESGELRAPLVVVDLDHGEIPPATYQSAVVVGLDAARSPGADGCDVVISEVGGDVSRAAATVDAVGPVLDLLEAVVSRWPRAALTLVSLLRLTARTSIADGLLAESAAYSMLLAGPEFARWRAARPVRPIPVMDSPAVLVRRDEDVLTVTLNRPSRRNAFGVQVRDGLIDALDVLIADETIRCAVLGAAGPDFCSGGDLDEFGTTTDVALAHLIRLDRSVASRLARCRDRVRVDLHGSCVGAGIEIPSFAGRVRATPDTVIRLPELGMGLIPGAGGTVGVTRRIGRWRTAYLALTGAPLAAADALAWGLVDELS